MDLEAQPMTELKAREVPRRAKKTTVRLAASMLVMSCFSFMTQSSSVDKTSAKVVEAARLQPQSNTDRSQTPFHKRLETKRIVLELISKTMQAPEFGAWISTVQHHSTDLVQSSQPNHRYLSVSINDSVFLACTRAHESDNAGGYRAVSVGGTYRGAYQFDKSTWDSAAILAGRPDLVEILPDQATAHDQDLLALDLYHERGNQPWGGRC